MGMDCSVFDVKTEFFKCLSILSDKHYYTDFVYIVYLILLRFSAVHISRCRVWVHKG